MGKGVGVPVAREYSFQNKGECFIGTGPGSRKRSVGSGKSIRNSSKSNDSTGVEDEVCY